MPTNNYIGKNDGIGKVSEYKNVWDKVNDINKVMGTDGVFDASDLPAGESDHSHANKVLLDTYTQLEADLADAVAKKHDASLQALKNVATVEAVSAVTAIADASAVDNAYDQTEVQAIVDLANDLKAKYNAAVVLINEMKTIIDAMNA